MPRKPFVSLTQMVGRARDNLDRNVWDYLMGGADTEASLNRNRAGVDSWLFQPRILNDVSEVDVSALVLGQDCRLPVVLPPIGSVQLFDESGGQGVAQAAQEFGVLQILSSACLPDFEEVAQQVPGPRIYQLYLVGDQAWMDDTIARAMELGYTGFCLTADTQTYSRRERDILKRFVPPSGRQAGSNDFTAQARMTWDTVAHIKETFSIPLIIKGVATARDAAMCAQAGVDVVYVSNHGGRQLDHTRACIDLLPEITTAVDGRAPVWVDGGFMRGADVLKALCLGASAVGMGRFEGLAMAAGGASALVAALEILEHELKISLALLGCASLAELAPEHVTREEALRACDVLSAFPLLGDY